MITINESVYADIILSDGTEISVSPSDITGEFAVSSRAVSGSGFELGGVCSSQLCASFILPEINSYDIFAAQIIPKILRNNSEIPLGVFNVTSTKKFRDVVSVTASDNLMLLDKSAFSVDENERKINLIAHYLHTEHSVYDALKYIVEDIGGLELAQNQAEINAMPNGNMHTIVFEDIKTNCPRDWLSWCAEALGGFAYADEYGKIGIKQFDKVPSTAIVKNMIQNNSLDIAGFQMHLSKVEMDVWDSSYGAYYTSYDNQPNTIYVSLSDNPIVQGKHYLYGNAMDILGGVTAAVRIPYRPFSAIVHSDEIYRIGQCISIENHDGTTYDTVITNHIYKLNGGQKIQCAGSDSRLLGDSKKRSALKRESEKLQTMIEESKGKNVTESEMETIIQSGKFKEGQVFYIYDDESE